MTKDIGLKRRVKSADKEQRAAILDGVSYKVGFGKPPTNTRFSPTNQPAGRGRPKASENLATIVEEELATTIVVTENGKQRKLSKQRVAVRQLVNKCASGDIKAFAQVLDLQRKTGLVGSTQPEATLLLDQRDFEAIERLAAFLGLDAEDEDRGGDQ